MNDVRIPLKKRFSKMPTDFKRTFRDYCLKILPDVIDEDKRLSESGLEENLENFETMVEEGGLIFEKQEDDTYKVMLYNLFTHKYEDITHLKEKLKEIDADED